MSEADLLTEVGWIVIAAAVMHLATRRIRIPGIAAYMAAGLILGPATGWIAGSDTLHIISEAGIVLLLFLVGLELSLKKIQAIGYSVLIIGAGQLLFSILTVFIVGLALGFSGLTSVILGTALAFSSTVVGVKLLEDRMELDTLHGRVAVGVLLVQDLAVIIGLTFLSGLEAGKQIELAALAKGLLAAFGKMALLLAAVLGSSRWLLPRPFNWVSRSPESLFIWSLCWCFLVVTAAEKMHLSVEIGAFLAGLSLASFPFNHDLRRRVNPLLNFFIAVFFVSLGIQMPLGSAAENWRTALLLSALVLISKPVFIYALGRWKGCREESALASGIVLSQVSEFSFIFAGLALDKQLLAPEVLALIAMVGLVTIPCSSLALSHLNGTVRFILHARDRLFGRTGAAHPDLSRFKTHLADHVIIIGMNSLGRELAQRLTEAGETVLALDTDPQKMKGLECHKLIGNAEDSSVLEEASLKLAKLVVSALHIEDANDLIAFRCKKAGVRCSIHVVDLNFMDNLLEMDVTYLMIPKVDGIKLQTQELKRMGLLET